MAHKSSTGTVKNGRDSVSKRLGLKKVHNQICKKGQILIRQRGLTILPGLNVGTGKDFTLYALKNGTIKFKPIIVKKNYKKRMKLEIITTYWENLLITFDFKNFLQIKNFI